MSSWSAPLEIKLDQDADFHLWSILAKAPQGTSGERFDGVNLAITSIDPPYRGGTAYIPLSNFKNSTLTQLTPSQVAAITSLATTKGDYNIQISPWVKASETGGGNSHTSSTLVDITGKKYRLQNQVTCTRPDSTKSIKWTYDLPPQKARTLSRSELSDGFTILIAMRLIADIAPLASAPEDRASTAPSKTSSELASSLKAIPQSTGPSQIPPPSPNRAPESFLQRSTSLGSSGILFPLDRITKFIRKTTDPIWTTIVKETSASDIVIDFYPDERPGTPSLGSIPLALPNTVGTNDGTRMVLIGKVKLDTGDPAVRSAAWSDATKIHSAIQSQRPLYLRATLQSNGRPLPDEHFHLSAQAVPDNPTNGPFTLQITAENSAP